MKYFRKLICCFFGHRSICVAHYAQVLEGSIWPRTFFTAFKCERCGHSFTEGWDC